jgi:iron complex outermembrane receptor protein/hemoglobin/transferrin/lactoferrin receptor protein
MSPFRRTRLTRVAPLSLSLLCLASPALAQESSPPPESAAPTEPATPDAPDEAAAVAKDGAGETLVTSTRSPQMLDEESRVASVVTSEELSRRPPHSTPEALLEEEGVFLQRTNPGGGAPIIRGLYGQQVLILVDGVRLNNAITRAGPNQSLNTIDPFLVERLEVVRGPGSVLYGSDALGGVVNVLTLMPRFASGEASGVRAGFKSQAGSADTSLQGSLRLGVETQNTAALGVVTGRDFNDVRAGADVGVQRYTGYEEYDAALKVRQRLAPGVVAQVQYQATRQEGAPRTDRSRPGDYRLFSLQERDFLHGQLAVGGAGPFSRVRVDVSALRQGERQERFRTGRNTQEREDINTWTLGLRAEGERGFDWRDATLLTGVEFFHDRVTNAATRGALLRPGEFSPRPELNRYPGVPTSLAAALFGMLRLDVGPDATAHAGVRGQLNRTHLPEDNRLALQFSQSPAVPSVLEASTESALGLAGEAGLQQRVTEDVSLFTNLGTGFRAPNVDDYLRLGVEGPGFALPTRGLEPEVSYTAEVGTRFQRGETRLQAVYAYTLIDGLVTLVPTTLDGQTETPDGLRYLKKQNADSAQLHSVELSGQVRPVRQVQLAAHAAYTYTRQQRLDPLNPEADAVIEPMSKSPPLFGMVRATYEPLDFLFVEGLMQWAAAQRRLSENDREDVRICAEAPGCEGTPGWAAFHLRAGARWRSLAGSVTLQNLFDKTYRYHASGVDMPGRSVVVAVEGSL